MVPICYEEALPQGCSPLCAGFMATATEHFIKEVLSVLLSRSRSNMPGGSVNSILTHRYKKQLFQEEDARLHNQPLQPPGLMAPLPEPQAVAGTELLGMSDIRLALSIGESGLGQFPFAITKVHNVLEDGEYENYQMKKTEEAELLKERQTAERQRLELLKAFEDADGDIKMNGAPMTNGIGVDDSLMFYEDDNEDADWGWDGASTNDRNDLNSLLDECLAVGL
jgi:transcriptional coactivator HFI1/ADA1